MAWITKNSGTMQIDRRSEPYLTEEMKQQFEAEVMIRYPTRMAATLPLLHKVQDTHGWIPYQAIEEIAAFTDQDASRVLDTATFYEEFFLQPKGRYVIWVCQSIACELLGHHKLIEACEAKLGIDAGETTEDGRFTLMHVECLGSCGTAPCALVNERLHENLTAENLDRILDELE